MSMIIINIAQLVKLIIVIISDGDIHTKLHLITTILIIMSHVFSGDRGRRLKYYTGRGGGDEGGASRPYFAWGGGRGGGSEGAWGISLTLGPSSFFVLPGPHARLGAFQHSPFKAAYKKKWTVSIKSGQKIITGHWTFSNQFKWMSDHLELII